MPEVSIWHGLHPDFVQQVESLMDSRLKDSSKSTINTALTKWWEPYCDKYELGYFVPTAHRNRGAIMAGFVLFMSCGDIVYSTMQGYVWAVCDHHISSGYASPLCNVRDWKPFVHSAEVEWGKPSVPRRMVPWLLYVRSLARVDFTRASMVGVAALMLILFFIVSRPELLLRHNTGLIRKNT